MPATQTIASAIPDFTGQILNTNMGRITLKKVIGEGAYGVVYHAIGEIPNCSSSSCTGPKEFAVKVLTKADESTVQGKCQAREVVTHKIASEHPNVLTLHQVIEDDWFIYLILDYCPGGDLFGKIVEQLKYCRNDDLVKKVFCQILDAVQSCHEKGIYHRDLKPDNIFVNLDGTETFLGDFGLATDSIKSRSFGCGSSYYMSPECIGIEFHHMPYSTEASDVWALGVILTNMIAGRNPWKYATTDDEHFLHYMADHDYLLKMLPISKSANEILKSIFTFNPCARINIPELREDIMAVDTFFLTEEQIAKSSPNIRKAADAYRPLGAAIVKLEHKAHVGVEVQVDVKVEKKSVTVEVHPSFIRKHVLSDEGYLFASPNPDIPIPMPSPAVQLFTDRNIFTIGSDFSDDDDDDLSSERSNSSSGSSSSSDESVGPLTPETPICDNGELLEVPELLLYEKFDDVVLSKAPLGRLRLEDPDADELF